MFEKRHMLLMKKMFIIITCFKIIILQSKTKNFQNKKI